VHPTNSSKTSVFLMTRLSCRMKRKEIQAQQ